MAVEYTKTLQVRHSADIVVTGGGPAGAAAAVCVEDGTNAKSADVDKIKNYIQKAYR